MKKFVSQLLCLVMALTTFSFSVFFSGCKKEKNDEPSPEEIQAIDEEPIKPDYEHKGDDIDL